MIRVAAEAQRLEEGGYRPALVLSSVGNTSQFAFPCVQNISISQFSCRVGKENEITILK